MSAPQPARPAGSKRTHNRNRRPTDDATPGADKLRALAATFDMERCEQSLSADRVGMDNLLAIIAEGLADSAAGGKRNGRYERGRWRAGDTVEREQAGRALRYLLTEWK